MSAGAAALAWRRFGIQVNGANMEVFDSGVAPYNRAANTAAESATVGQFVTQSTTERTSTALAAAGTQTLSLFTLQGGGVILACKMKHSLAFTGGAVTACTVEVGRAADTAKYGPRFNVFQAAADTGAARSLQIGPQFRTAVFAGAAAAGDIAVTGLIVGDRLLGVFPFAPALGFTQTGSAAAGTGLNVGNFPVRDGPDAAAAGFRSVVTTADNVHQNDSNNISANTFLGIFQSNPLESDAAAGTAINAIFRTTGANVSALTAGRMEIALLILDSPQLVLGSG